VNGRIEFRVDVDDDKAQQLHALLTVLGYEPARVLADDAARVQWAVLVMRRRFGLASTECNVLTALLSGTDVEQLGLSQASMRWHMHTLLSFSGSANVGELLATARNCVVWPDREEDIDDRGTSGS